MTEKKTEAEQEQELRESPVGQDVAANYAAANSTPPEDLATAQAKMELDQHDAELARQAAERDAAATGKNGKPTRTKRSAEEKAAEQDDSYPTEQLQTKLMPNMQIGSPNDNKGPVNMDVVPVGVQPDGQDLAPPHPDLWRKSGHG